MLVALGVAVAALAQSLDLQPPAESPRAAQECGSVIIVRCERATEPEEAPPDAFTQSLSRTARRFEQRREDTTRLDTVVVEGAAPKPMTLDQAFAHNLTPGGPATFQTSRMSDGRLCTCVRPCWINCCTCTAGVDSGPAAPGFNF